MLLLEYENKQREAYLTVRTTGGKCLTSKDAAELFGQAVGSGSWYAPPDTRALVTRQPAVIRFSEAGDYRMMYGVARLSKDGEGVSGDNYTFSDSLPGQVVMNLSDGMGSGEGAAKESRKVVELTEQLLEKMCIRDSHISDHGSRDRQPFWRRDQAAGADRPWR